MKISPRHYAKALYESLNEKNVNTDEVITRFVDDVRKTGNMDAMRTILSEYGFLYNKEEDIQDVIIVSHRELIKKEKSVIENHIDSFLGKKGSITYTVNDALIGGIQIFTNGKMIDLSAISSLNQFITK